MKRPGIQDSIPVASSANAETVPFLGWFRSILCQPQQLKEILSKTIALSFADLR
jgi:hypothetical protein